MEINLSDIPIGIAQSEYELKVLKSAKMYRELKKFKSDYNHILVPISLLNIIEHHDYFDKSSAFKEDCDTGVYFVGQFCDLNVYVDLFLHPSQVILSHSKQVIRDNKIDSILSNSNSKSELVIEVYD